MNSFPVRWQQGTVDTLITRYGQASTVNDRSQMVGLFYGSGSFLWSDGQLTDLDVPPGAMVLQAQGTNDRGQVVGSSATNLDGTNPHAVLWTR